jgi:hypothetical protein
MKKFQWKMHFLVTVFFFFNLPLKRYKIALTTGTSWQIFWWITPVFLIWFNSNLISTKFEKEIVFESSVLVWIRIRNWIRIKSIRIHYPVANIYSSFLWSHMKFENEEGENVAIKMAWKDNFTFIDFDISPPAPPMVLFSTYLLVLPTLRFFTIEIFSFFAFV